MGNTCTDQSNCYIVVGGTENPRIWYHPRNYRLCSLSMRIAHSTTVTPFFRASSFTSRSRVSSRIRASAVMCSECRTPSSSRMGKRCKREGWQEARTDPIWAADVTLVWEVASETEALYSVPLGPAEGETGPRRLGFCGVDGWGVVLMGAALASGVGVKDLPVWLGCRDVA